MTDQPMTMAQERPYKNRPARNSVALPIYGFGFFGALVYYIEHAATLGMGLLGVLKAIAWPAMIVYKVLELLKM